MVRKKWGTDVAKPKPFTIFVTKRGLVGVRIGAQRPFFTAAEVALNAGLSIVTASTEDGLRISGEGVVRRHRNTIAVTP